MSHTKYWSKYVVFVLCTSYLLSPSGRNEPGQVMLCHSPVTHGSCVKESSWLGWVGYHLNRSVNTDLNTNQHNTCLSGCLKTTTIDGLRLLSLVPAPVQWVLDGGWKKWVQPHSELDPDPKHCGEGRWWMEFSASLVILHTLLSTLCYRVV